MKKALRLVVLSGTLVLLSSPLFAQFGDPGGSDPPPPPPSNGPMTAAGTTTAGTTATTAIATLLAYFGY